MDSIQIEVTVFFNHFIDISLFANVILNWLDPFFVEMLDFLKKIVILISALPEKVGRENDKSYRGYLIEFRDEKSFFLYNNRL